MEFEYFMARTKKKKKKVINRNKQKHSLVSWISLSIALVTLGVAGYALKLQMINRIEKQPAVGVWLEKIIFYGEYDNNLSLFNIRC